MLIRSKRLMSKPLTENVTTITHSVISTPAHLFLLVRCFEKITELTGLE